MTEMRTYSVLLNWSDSDRDQGTFASCVRATSEDEAEAKAREEMRASYVEERGEDRAEAYENENWDGTRTFGGAVVDISEGAIWRAADLEAALRRLLASVDEHAARLGWADHGEREGARKLIAEIDGIA